MTPQRTLFLVMAVGGPGSGTLADRPFVPYKSGVADKPSLYCLGAESSTQAKRQEDSLYRKIDQVCADPDSYEEGEPRSTPEIIAKAKQILIEAESALDAPLPLGDVAPYFGELNITWHHGKRVLRLTVSPENKPTGLAFGSTPVAGFLGHFDFHPMATGTLLADKLNWLTASEQALNVGEILI